MKQIEESAATMSSRPCLKPLTSTIRVLVMPPRSNYAPGLPPDAPVSALDGPGNRRIETRELREPGPTLGAKLVDALPVFFRRVVRLRGVPREIEIRHGLRRLVAPVRILFPLDAFLGD